MFPVGAKVWLAATPSHNPHSAYLATPSEAWSLAVRDKQGGTLLFASGYTFTEPAPQPAFNVFPFVVRNVTPTCKAVVKNPYCWDLAAMGTLQVTHASAEIKGEGSVTIDDGQTKRVGLRGVDYDVSVHATDVGDSSCKPIDMIYPKRLGGIAVDARAHDLASLIGALPISPLPSCTQGNATSPQIFTSGSTSDDFDGAVTYVSNTAGVLGFQASGGRDFSISGLPSTFTQPQTGSQLWLTTVGGSGGGSLIRFSALREQQGGQVAAGVCPGLRGASQPGPRKWSWAKSASRSPPRAAAPMRARKCRQRRWRACGTCASGQRQSFKAEAWVKSTLPVKNTTPGCRASGWSASASFYASAP